MGKENIMQKLSIIFNNVLEHNNFTLNSNTTANDVDGWDSITHMMIINEIEQEYNFKFKLMDLMNLENVGDLIKVIESEIISK